MRRASDRAILSKAKPEYIIRFAKYLDINTKDNCICDGCIIQLIEIIVRKIQ